LPEDSFVLFDTHTHLNDPLLHTNLVEVLQRAKEAHVEKMASVGYDWASSLMSLRLAEKYPGTVYAVTGLHPHDADLWNEETAEKFYTLCANPLAVAIGEIGFDYHYEGYSQKKQEKAFREQIAFARELGKPLVIHDRDAHADTLRVLKEEKAGLNGGIMHCYSGSFEMAQEYIRMGFEISFAGPVTYQNARALAQVAARVPLEHLLIETDCPYLSPHPYRGKTNEPARVVLVAEKIAELKNLPFEKVAKITTANALRVYRIY